MSHTAKQTAVLVVHGMGLQRPLDTTRGLIKALWLSGDRQDKNSKIWIHPELSPIDIDLPVITTSVLPCAEGTRTVDFHELYRSHLMSETPGIAVLLWLFEFVKKGPRLAPNMRLLWWAGALFLDLMIFSAALLVTKLIERLAGVAGIQESILIAPVLMFFILSVLCFVIFLSYRAWRFALLSGVVAVLLGIIFFTGPVHAGILVVKLLSALVALVATLLLMGKWGFGVFILTYALSFVFEVLVRVWQRALMSTPLIDLLPWSLNSSWCVVAACIILATYVVINMVFLVPYLGDAARYFRNAPSNVAVRREIRWQAVSTLEGLHLSGRYDRIVVVAHSLGTVIAYDMLRSYFGRVAGALPAEGGDLANNIDQVECGTLSREAMRAHGRGIIREMETVLAGKQPAAESASAPHGSKEYKTWLVTDFVTLGSPLTYARYLMCRGRTPAELDADFKRRVSEREFPVCPPARIDNDGYLTSTRECAQGRRFHSGALFGLTRWTNLYFPVTELFWGDAIGGPLNGVFGEGIFDVPLHTDSSWRNGLSAHLAYWRVPEDYTFKAPNILCLRNAVDLADRGLPDHGPSCW